MAEASKLRVVHVVSGDLWGGAEAQVHTLCKYLKRDNGLTVNVIILNEGELRSRLENEGVKTYLLDEKKISAVQICVGMRRLFLQLRPDVIHTHRQKENILACIANQLSVRAPSVRTQHGAPEFDYSWRQPHKKVQAALDHFCGRYLQRKVIAVSDELAGKLNDLFPKDHIVTIENGVDIELYDSQHTLASFKLNKPNVRHVGIVGRLVPVKRVDIFIATAALLKSAGQSKELEDGTGEQNFAFHVIGDGPLRSELEAYAQTLGLGDELTFHGHCNDVASYIYSLDALLMCSDHEGLPMTLLEAMTLQTPVVGHNVGAMKKNFAERVGGVLAEMHTAESYAKTVGELLAHPAPDIMKKGLESVKGAYSARLNADKISLLYSQLVQ